MKFSCTLLIVVYTQHTAVNICMVLLLSSRKEWL